MEEYVGVLRKCIVIGVWIYVAIQMWPAAESRDRNPFLWFLIGLFAFYVPFTVVGFLPPILLLIFQVRTGIPISDSLFGTIGMVAFIAGVTSGFACLRYARDRAAAPRKRARSPSLLDPKLRK